MNFLYLNKFYSCKSLLQIKTEEKWLLDIQSFLNNWHDTSKFINVTTSGSTGTPKSIKLLKSSMRTSAKITNNYFKLNSNNIALLCLPAKYIAGKMMVVRAIESDFDLIIQEPSGNPLKEIERSLDFVAMTPLQIETVLDGNPDKLNLIHTAILGGGAVSNSLSIRLVYVKCQCYQTYGMTETITHIALQPLNGTNKSDHFQVLEGFEIDQDDRSCLSISAGHIYEKYVITNDIVDILDPKSFRWLGRYDNVINTGGIKVYPEVIESKIQSIIDHPFFIIGKDDDTLGQQVTLCLESDLLSSTDQVVLLKQIKSRLSKFEIPRSILFFDCFLYTETGKIRRRATLESY